MKGKRSGGQENSFEHGYLYLEAIFDFRTFYKNNFFLVVKNSCGRSKKCSKPNAHPECCDSKRVFHKFWKSSTSHIALKRKGEVNEENRKIEELYTKKACLDEVGKYHRVL